MGDWVVESPSFIEQLMSNKIVMLNQNGVNEVVKIIGEKDKKIERLNKEIIGLNNCIIEFHSEFCNKQAEINRTNNIINELEKWLVEWREMLDCPDFYEEGIIDCINDTLTKLQELKGSNDNE